MARDNSDAYDDLGPLFVELVALTEDAPRREELRAQLIERCLPLADHIAQKFSGRGEPFDDVAQVARLGLLHAVDRYDPARGFPFLSFAVPTIMGEVRRYFRDNTWAMRVPRRVKEVYVLLGPAIDELSQRLGRSPTASELAAELDIDASEVTQALIAVNAYQPTSIDTATSGSDHQPRVPLLETLGDAEPRYERVEEYLSVQPLIAELPERERRILILRFFESKPQSEIAKELGISQMHVSRILAKTVALLRERSDRETP